MASKYGNSLCMCKEDRKKAYQLLTSKMLQIKEFKGINENVIYLLAEEFISSINIYLSNNNFNQEEYLTLMNKTVVDTFYKRRIAYHESLIKEISSLSIMVYYNCLRENQNYNINLESKAGNNIIEFIKK